MNHNESIAPTEILEQIEQLPWVTRVEQTKRPDATHAVWTDLTIVRRLEEVHDLENCGVDVEAFSAVPDHGSHIYITVRQ